jgi:hypothetical protein
MNLQDIIENLANRADDFLADAANAKEARTTIGEVLAKEYPKLGGVERQKVAIAVVGILEEEGFFDGGRKGDSFDEEAASADE